MLQKGTAGVADTICGKHSSVRPASTCSASDLREPSQDGSGGSVSQKRHSLVISRRQTQLEREGGEESQAGAVSERMSIRQPVSRAASRAFWPSRPMASDN
jgi:hypothetical protein